MAEPNPYTAPKSDVRSSNIPSGRPGWVWAIFIFYLFSAVMTVASFGILLSGKIPLPEETQQYLNNLTPIDYAVSLLMMCVNLAAALFLFMLRRFSFDLFIFALLISVLYTVWHGMTTGLVGAGGGTGVIGLLFGYGIKVAICVYAWRLKNAGVLK